MKLKFAFRLSALVCAALSATVVLAEPAVVFDMGGKFDKSFNEAAYNGMEKWKKETGKSDLLIKSDEVTFEFMKLWKRKTIDSETSSE